MICGFMKDMNEIRALDVQCARILFSSSLTEKKLRRVKPETIFSVFSINRNVPIIRLKTN